MMVELKKWSAEKKPELIRIMNHTDRSYLRNRIPEPYTEADADRWLSMIAEKDGKEGLWRAILSDGEYVGNISIEIMGDVDCKNCELGYTLDSDYTGKGIAGRAAGEMVRLAFSLLPVERITAEAFRPNLASQRVLEKNGFRMEGLLRNAVWKKGKLYDKCIYGLLREELL